MAAPAGYTIDQPQAGPPPGYTLDKPSAPEQSFSQEHHLGPIAAPVSDALEGVGAGVWSTLQGAYNLIRMVPGVGDKLPPPSEFVKHLAVEPDTMAGHAGKLAEQGAEFVIPAAKAAKLTEGANLIVRMAGQGAAAAGTRAVQTGGDVPASVDAGLVGAAGPAVGAAYGAIAPKVAEAVPEIAKKVALGVAGRATGLPISSIYKAISKTAPLANKVTAASEAAEQEASLLDDLSQALAKRPFKNLSAEAQQTIRDIAAKGSTAPAPQAAAPPAPAPAPTAAPATTPTPVPAAVAPPAGPANTFVPGGPVRPPLAQAPVAPPVSQAAPVAAPAPQLAPAALPDLRELAKLPAKEAVAKINAARGNSGAIAKQLADEMLRSGTATDSMIVPEEAAHVTDEGKLALRDLMRSVSPEHAKALADATYAGAPEEGEVAGAAYEAAARADKAQKLANALSKGGVSAADAERIEKDHWDLLSKAIGVRSPSKATIGEVLFRLKRMEAPAAGRVQ